MIYFVGDKSAVDFDDVEYSSIGECYEWLKKASDIISLDTETEGFFDHQNRMIMLQLSDGLDSYVIDTRFTSISILKDEIQKKTIIGHNLKFDYKFLRKEDIILKDIFDTFLAECVLTTGRKERTLSLEGCLLKYMDIKLDKSVRGSFLGLNGRPFTKKQVVYGAEDVLNLHKLRDYQLKEINNLKLNNVLRLENNVCLCYADMEYDGMGFDSKPWLELADKAESLVKTFEIELDNYVLNDYRLQAFVKKYIQVNLFDFEERLVTINWGSPVQIKRVFETLLGIELESTEERFLTKYQKEYPLIKKFIDYKKQQKLVSTYGKTFTKHINPITNRIHTEFWQVLETGRVSTGGKGDSGVNMQNLPAKKEYRNCFIPQEGKMIVSGDFSGQELRIIAEGSQDPIWLTAFLEERDLHSEVASMTFGVDISEVEDKPDFLRGKSYRDVAKTISFGLAYGMSAFKLSDTLDISVDEAQTIINKYFKNLPKVKEFLDMLGWIGKQGLSIRTFQPFGRIRFFDLDTRNDFKRLGAIERASKNTPIQGTGADMCKLALIKLRNYIYDNNLNDKVTIIMTVHDQIDSEVDKDFAEEWAIVKKRLMEEAGSTIIKSIPVISKITISNCWTK
jgi:DNA polymerase I